jgi:hypothetical protein
MFLPAGGYVASCLGTHERSIWREACMINRQVVLVSRPIGIAQAENFAIREAPVVLPAEGQILARNEFLSVEPAMRGSIADHGNYSARAGAIYTSSKRPTTSLSAWVKSRSFDPTKQIPTRSNSAEMRKHREIPT